MQCPPELNVRVSFIELYNDSIIDLLSADSVMGTLPDGEDGRHTPGSWSSSSRPSTARERPRTANGATVREHGDGTIHLVGVSQRDVKSKEGVLTCLDQGTMNRTTASTDMNSTSSRSHAIFTVYVDQQRQIKVAKVSSMPGLSVVENHRETCWSPFPTKWLNST